MSKFLALFFIFIVIFHAKSQEKRQFRYVKYGENFGLNCDFVYNATQDANGQMWFATQNGLYTFDNKYFLNYTASNTHNYGNLNNILYGLYYDQVYKSIWCSSIDGFMFFNPIEKTFQKPPFGEQLNNEIANLQAFIFYRDQNKRMWLGTQNKGLVFLNEQKNKLETLIQGQNGVFPKVFDVVETKDHNIWVSSSWGLYKIGLDFKINLFQFKDNLYFSDIEYDETNNCLWIGSKGNGLFKFDLKKEAFSQFKLTSYHQGKFLNDGIFHSLKFLNENELVVEGRYLFNTIKNEFFELKVDFNDFDMNPTHVEKILKDIEGNLWLCTYSGLFLMPLQNQNITSVKITNPLNDFGIEIHQSLSIKQQIYYWSPDFKGLMMYDIESKTKYSFPLNIDTEYQITSICKTPNHTIFVSTTAGVFEFVLSNHAYKKADFKLPEELLSKIINIYIDQYENIFTTIQNKGLYVFRPLTDTKFKKVIDFVKDFPTVYVSAKAEDQLGNVWCVSPKGLFSIHTKSLKVKNFFGKVNSKASNIKEVNDVVCDKNNHVWFTDFYSGISEFYVENKEVVINNVSLSFDFGFQIKRASSLVLDQNSLLWASTLDGLVAIDIRSKQFKAIIRKQQGFSTNSFERQVFMVNNHIAVTEWSQFELLNLSKYQWNLKKPNLIFSNVVIGKKNHHFLSNNQYKVEYNEGFFSMNVGSTSYTNGNQNQFFYQLSGIDKSIRKIGNNHSISYSGLPSGSYVLKVWTSNCNGIQSDIKKIHLIVQLPFYKTWWFLISSVLFVLILVYYLYRIRIQNIKNEAKLKAEYSQKIAETEMKALRAQMNPHFMFNAMNSIQKYILKNEPKLASQYLTKFSRLIRVILEQSQKKNVTIAEEIELLLLYTDLEKMRFDNQFEFIVEIDPNINKETILFPSMILQPFIENAIWHGLLHKNENGIINLVINKTNNKTIEIIITDNGVGRKKAEEFKSKQALKNKSFGMSITKDRLNLIEQFNAKVNVIDLEDENLNSLGTKIEILLPLINLNHD